MITNHFLVSEEHGANVRWDPQRKILILFEDVEDKQDFWTTPLDHENLAPGIYAFHTDGPEAHYIRPINDFDREIINLNVDLDNMDLDQIVPIERSIHATENNAELNPFDESEERPLRGVDNEDWGLFRNVGENWLTHHDRANNEFQRAFEEVRNEIREAEAANRERSASRNRNSRSLSRQRNQQRERSASRRSVSRGRSRNRSNAPSTSSRRQQLNRKAKDDANTRIARSKSRGRNKSGGRKDDDDDDIFYGISFEQLGYNYRCYV